MSDLIPLAKCNFNGQDKETVNARHLHEFLEIKTRMTTWIQRRIDEYGFSEGTDFISLSNLKAGNPTPQREYFLSLEMAKEISMVERNAKGKQARIYFIECERRLKDGMSRMPQVRDPRTQLLIETAIRLDAIEQKAEEHDRRLSIIESKRPPEGKMTVIEWLNRHNKSSLPKRVRDIINAECRRIEEPEKFTPDGVMYPWLYYSPYTIQRAYAEATRQLPIMWESHESAVPYERGI